MANTIDYSNNKIQYHLSKIAYHAKKIGIKNVDITSRSEVMDILELWELMCSKHLSEILDDEDYLFLQSYYEKLKLEQTTTPLDSVGTLEAV